MSSEMKIEYYSPDFLKFKQDVLNENLKGVMVSKLMPFAPAVVVDFKQITLTDAAIDKADIVINIDKNNEPATIYGRSDAGKRFIKTRKYSILK